MPASCQRHICIFESEAIAKGYCSVPLIKTFDRIVRCDHKYIFPIFADVFIEIGFKKYCFIDRLYDNCAECLYSSIYVCPNVHTMVIC